MALVFIDSDGWLGFWKTGAGRHSGELIPALLNLRDHLFIPRQTKFEVERQKLNCLLAGASEGSKGQLPTGFPNHLLAADRAHEWQDLRDRITSDTKRLHNDWNESLVGVAEQVSRSGDEATRALAPLFDAAVAETPDQLSRARLRRERGNPPGKQRDKLGDQISWEQLLDHCEGKDTWLVSNDNDYSLRSGGESLLNPLLRRELTECGARDVKVFRALADLVAHARQAGLDVRDAPAPKRLEELAREEAQPHRRVPIVAFGPASGACPICSQTALVGPAARPGPYGFAWYSTCTSCGALIYVDDYCD